MDYYESESTAYSEKRFSKPAAIFFLFRLNRTIMVSMIAGTGAFISGAGAADSLWMALAGWLLAVGGFSLDLYADRDLDTVGPRAETRHNPFSDGSLGAKTGVASSSVFIFASMVIAMAVNPWTLIPWTVILAVIIALALHWLETPLARAFSLGILQALYLLMGGAAGHINAATWLIAAMFFFAMFGGRGITDIRDYPQDMATRVETLSKRYGIRRTAVFTTTSLLVSFALSLGVLHRAVRSSLSLPGPGLHFPGPGGRHYLRRPPHS
jgi:4-hydroxybenzoate polyprenyltransferase